MTTNASGCIASSIRSPSWYGHGYQLLAAIPGISSSRSSEVNETKRALAFGSTASSRCDSENPVQGTFIAHRSTQRKW